MTDFPTGWTPYVDRSPAGQLLTDEFNERIGVFATTGPVPELVYFPALQVEVFGKQTLRVWQTSGSCVGSAANNAYLDATLGDIHHRGDPEELKVLFPFSVYGIGRRKSGAKRPGEGSYGAAQAWAAEHYGTNALDSVLGLPKPKILLGNWMQWDSRIEVQWSHPSSWPIDEAKMTAEANKTKIGTVVACKSIDQLESGLAQGYGCTIASMFGSRTMRMEQKVLIARRDGSWAHQMSVIGFASRIDDYWDAARGKIYFVQNQWGDAHPHCDYQYGFHKALGNFAIKEREMQWIIDNGEVYLHSNTDGFPARVIDWDQFVWDYDWGFNLA